MSGYGKAGVNEGDWQRGIRWCSRLILGTKEAISSECCWDTPEYLNSQKRLNKLKDGNTILARIWVMLKTKPYLCFMYIGQKVDQLIYQSYKYKSHQHET